MCFVEIQNIRKLSSQDCLGKFGQVKRISKWWENRVWKQYQKCVISINLFKTRVKLKAKFGY